MNKLVLSLLVVGLLSTSTKRVENPFLEQYIRFERSYLVNEPELGMSLLESAMKIGINSTMVRDYLIRHYEAMLDYHRNPIILGNSPVLNIPKDTIEKRLYDLLDESYR